MPATKKTDNHNFAAKLALRRRFIERYHGGEFFSVFDACRGSGRLWKTLGRSYGFEYWGVDTKKERGQITADSVRLLEIPGLSANVIDVDTYGSPWKHWLALLPNVSKPTTVFLTDGLVKIMGGGVGHEVVRGLGLIFPTLKPSNALVAKFSRLNFKYMISLASKHGLQVREIVEALNPGGNARYFGVRLEPKPNVGPGIP